MARIAVYTNKEYRISIVALLCLSLTACLVGPNFRTPASPPVPSYTAKPLPAKTAQASLPGSGGRSQYFMANKDIPGEWWKLFHSQHLDALVRLGLLNSPNLAAAQAALHQAEENLAAQIGSTMFPQVNAVLSGQRQQTSANSLGFDIPSTIFNTFNTTVNVAYTLDFFGGARRQIEALAAQVNYQEYQLLAAYLTLTTNIVTTAITIASLEEQIRETNALINFEARQLDIIRGQFRLGAISEITVFTQETILEQNRATLPLLEKNLAQQQHALAVLVGAFPNELLASFNLNRLNLPKELPISLPSEFVRQRPDVGAAEALLHAASAQIGVATANLLPQITLNGYYGWSAQAPSGLFKGSSEIWSITGQLTQPIFQGGALLAQRRAAIAAYQQAKEQYKQTVLQAFQNVADVLRALETDARTLRAERKAEIAAEKNLSLAQNQYRYGSASYLDLVVAQEKYQQTKIARIRSQATRYADTAALFQALGGGWWHRPEFCITQTYHAEG